MLSVQPAAGGAGLCFTYAGTKKMEENIMRFTLDYDQYAALARQTAAEGCVLLKNEKEALPIRKGETVSVFGRIAFTLSLIHI